MLLALIWACAVGRGHAQSPTEPEVSAIRFGVNGPRTRVVLDLDRPVDYDARVQTNPDRLMVDLEEVRWRLGAATDVRPQGLARRHRYGSLASGRSRLEVDMGRPARVLGTILLPPSRDSTRHRLVVDLVADRGTARPADASPAANGLAAAAGVPVPAPRPAAVVTAALPAALAPANGRILPQARDLPAPPPKAQDLPVIVIDPGHGGVDPGAVAINGVYEKDIVLKMARELRAQIERSGKYRVALTRDGDVFIRLRDRIARARELGGQAFISLHADSLRVADQRGASVYTLSQTASDEEAARLAAKENKADILAAADLSQHDATVATILIDLAQRDTNNKSIAFADVLAEELAGVTPLVRRHRRFAGFAVLKSPDIPSVLLELGYLSNPDDARNLARPNYRAKLGQAIVRSLDRHFGMPRS
ncbi:MAG TPA: N-acetylmuramoyl-L-alanine amidase [Geminicoccaceae bacterium]|nr:N-acetylmuramoyl-L-alanine amidase [Geminicoccaceae bacterium]